MIEQVTVAIPRGVPAIDGSSWIQKVKLRQLNGYDEQFLLDVQNSLLPIHACSIALLKRVVSFGDYTEMLENDDIDEILRHLSIGDRTALLLHLRKMTFGDLLKCALACPSCSKYMSLDFSVTDILHISHSKPQKDYDLEIAGFSLKVRPLTGADQELIFDKYGKADNNNKISEELVRSCILYSNHSLPKSLPDDFIFTISSKLDEIDPLSDIVFNLICPNCQHTFQTLFDAERFIFHEIGLRQNQLEREIHWLAFNYKWTESEILSLPLKKRKRYVELINATLSGESL
jgi:hypothetical protein